MSPTGHPTLAHVLLEHADARGDQLAFEYLHDDGRVDTLTYRELAGRAAAAARRLRAADPAGGAALLLFPPGLDFVVAVWGCLLAGVPAVPAYPPLFGSADRVTQRFRRMVVDADASTVFADPVVLDALTALGARVDLPLVGVGEPGETADPPAALPGPEDVAVVQYTSGSTSQPKGVVLEHRNLVANTRAIGEVFGLDSTARVVSWLPPYHDMGLIGFLLTPVYGAFPARLMSPVHFLKNPLEWLRQISESRITHTGGPNFAYELCVRRARSAELAELDLSTWRVAFNGAEPIRARTLASFADRFAGNGFRPESFLPCYGLAEATLIVTGRHWSADDGVDSEGRVDCGPVIDGHALVVVDPERGEPVPEGVEGEIWVAGPSVSRGYWNDTGQDEDEAFGELDGRRYARTGDLGRLVGGGLVVTGRLKDVLIQNGVNHHAHDVEAAAVEDEPALRPTAAAFAVVGPEPELVLAVELARRDEDHEALVTRVRERVLAATGARLDTVVVCPPRTVPRTTSGKVQRRLTRERYLAGDLPGQAVSAGPAGEVPAAEPVERFLASVFAAVCEVPGCAPTQRLSAIGGDSVRAAEIAAVTEDALALPVPVESVLTAQSPRELTALLLPDWERSGVTGAEVVERLATLTASEGRTRT